jgi:xanthine/uracil permease
MNSKLKMLSLAIIVIAAIVLVLSYFMGWTNNNSVQFGALAAMIVGLIAYIIFGKKSLEAGE